MSDKIKVNFYLTKQLNEKINSLPRNILPNKSKLIEELLENWYEETRDKMDKEVS